MDKSLDEGNNDFQAESSSDDKLSDKDSDVEEITNEEIADALPSKTVPPPPGKSRSYSSRSQAPKEK